MIGKGMPNSKSTRERMVRPSKYICVTLGLGKSSMAVFDATMQFQIRDLVSSRAWSPERAVLHRPFFWLGDIPDLKAGLDVIATSSISWKDLQNG